MPKNVLHVVRGFHMSADYAEQVMREHCTIAWVVKGETIRDTTDEERSELRAAQAQQTAKAAPLPNAEIPGVIFDGPIPTDYSLIRAAHEFAQQATS